MSSGVTNDASMSICVNSGCRSARKSSSRKHFAIWKYFSTPADHEQLFVLLRRLRQRVKFSRRQSARHQKVARAFRRALRKDRRLDFDVALAVEIIARRFRDLVSHPEITREPRAAQIEIAIRQPQIFVVNLGVDRERQIVRAIQDMQFVWDDLDIAGRQFRIFRARHSRRNRTGDLNHVFAAQTVRLFRHRSVLLRAKDNLGQTFAIAQIDEDDAAMIARDVHPAGERDLLADVDLAKRIAIVRAIHVFCHSERSRGIPLRQL